MTPRPAAAGAIAGAAGLVAVELVGVVLPGAPSMVAAIGDRVVDLTPDGPREAIIGAVGTADKLVLITSIVITVLLCAAVAGAVAARSRRGATLAAVAAGLVGVALAAGPTLTTATVEFAALAGVGVVAFVLVLRGLLPAPAAPAAPTEEPVSLSRRDFLIRTTLVGGAALIGGGILVSVRRTVVAGVDTVRAALSLPRPERSLPPVPAGATPAVDGLAPAVTPNGDFYLIDTALIKPAVDPAGWVLSIGGRVASPLQLTYADLQALPQIEADVTLTCVSNNVGGDLVGNARWQGVRLRDLLERVGVQPEATMVTSESVDGFTAAFPLAVLSDDRAALVAIGMNGVPLPVEHGFPARLVVPGLYGYVSATKWLRDIRLTAVGDEVPFWVQRGWSADGSIEAASRIDVPRDGADVPAAQVVLAGRAWHQHIGVAEVQVSLDDGPWLTAVLADDLGIDSWRLWTWRGTVTAGDHEARVRMRGDDGAWQSETVRGVYPGAASGLHAVSFTAT